jgi:hypothetical protein
MEQQWALGDVIERDNLTDENDVITTFVFKEFAALKSRNASG